MAFIAAAFSFSTELQLRLGDEHAGHPPVTGSLILEAGITPRLARIAKRRVFEKSKLSEPSAITARLIP